MAWVKKTAPGLASKVLVISCMSITALIVVLGINFAVRYFPTRGGKTDSEAVNSEAATTISMDNNDSDNSTTQDTITFLPSTSSQSTSHDINSLTTTGTQNSGCIQASLGNSVCNVENLKLTCDYDGYDCCNFNASSTVANIGDGKCDASLNVLECGFDMGDCSINKTAKYANCSSAAFYSFDQIGDGICNDFFNNEMCEFDEQDCCSSAASSKLNCTTCTCFGKSSLSQCTKDTSYIGDLFCDDETNTEACAFDGGDCCSGLTFDNLYLFCTDCNCYFGNGSVAYTHAEVDLTSCTISSDYQDGYCDDGLNHPDCNFDGGDCCASPSLTNYCVTCACFTATQPSGICSADFIGDLYCDDENNNLDCFFDGGDCCMGANTDISYCTDCYCYLANGTIASTPDAYLPVIPACIETWKNDQICDDKNNNEECSFDGGDCCSPGADKALFCSDCHCRDSSSVYYYQGAAEITQTTTQSIDMVGLCNGDIGSIGDNKCDTSLNNEHCFFDGGDCCLPGSGGTCKTDTSISDIETSVAEQPCQCGTKISLARSRLKSDMKIVGGINADKYSFPWQVGITTGAMNPPFCGGTLIGPKTVLTAAHCVVDDLIVSHYRIIIGVTDVSNQVEMLTRSFSVKTITPHPDYDAETMEYDFAIIKLSKSVMFSHVANAACLPTSKNELFEGQNMIVSGWGNLHAIGQPEEYPTWLKFTRVTGVTNTACCNSMYGTSSCFAGTQSMPKIMLCAGAQGGGIDSCQGDSGGPLTYFNESSGRTMIVGVVSWGFGCAEPGNYGVYSRVSEMVDWIAQQADLYTQNCLNTI